MLDVQAEVGNFLEPPPVSPTDGATGTFALDANPMGATADLPGKGEHVGAILACKYKLIEEIGEGGMGSIYSARR